jgi:hypothetical protein
MAEEDCRHDLHLDMVFVVVDWRGVGDLLFLRCIIASSMAMIGHALPLCGVRDHHDYMI